jgi:hypothetical protein
MLKPFNDWIHCLGIFAALFVVAAENVSAQEDNQILEDVRRAWVQRSKAIKTFHYGYLVLETKQRAVKAGATDIFGHVVAGEPTEDITLSSSQTYSYAKGKLAWRMQGKQWQEQQAKVTESKIEAVFDGQTYKTLMQNTEAVRPHAIIDKSDPPNRMLTNYSDAKAFWLAFDPQLYFDRRGYDHAEMRIGQRQEFRDGHDCVHLLLPRRNKNWVGEVYADKTRAYIPVQFIERLSGAIASQIDIEYVPNKEVGWVVSSWHRTQFDKNGRATGSWQGVVQKVDINTELDNDLFALQFPTGTHVVEITNRGRKPRIQLKDGSLKPIKAREYGARRSLP